jgi:predicted dehydrogenase
MLRIGFVGAGFNAGFHARALRSVRGAEIAGVYAIAGAEEFSAKVCGEGLGQCSVFQNVADLCQAVDVVAISAPNFARLDIMREISEGGANLAGVICEKPLARNMAEANEMLDLAARFHTAYFENQIFMPTVTKARAQLAAVEAAMGPVHLARSAEEHGGPHEPWFWDPTRQGGGVWCDMGCHSAAVGWYMCTPTDKPVDYMVPKWVQGSLSLLKWGKEPWISQLRERGVDYDVIPAEDYANVTICFKNPDNGESAIVQATDSWMYDAPGLRLQMEAMAPGYQYVINTLLSPAGLFISDAAAAAIGDSELALEKSQSSQGALVLMEDEPATYGYCAEWRDALYAFEHGRDGMLNFAYGREIVRLVMAGYYSHQFGGGRVMVEDVPDDFVPLIQQGQGADILGC